VSDLQITRLNHRKDILGGLAIFVGFLALIAALALPTYFTDQTNAAKDRAVTVACIDHGYAGWAKDRGCFK
jgi:predicted transporter